jgi:hypothetical protein
LALALESLGREGILGLGGGLGLLAPLGVQRARGGFAPDDPLHLILKRQGLGLLLAVDPLLLKRLLLLGDPVILLRALPLQADLLLVDVLTTELVTRHRRGVVAGLLEIGTDLTELLLQQ